MNTWRRVSPSMHFVRLVLLSALIPLLLAACNSSDAPAEPVEAPPVEAPPVEAPAEKSVAEPETEAAPTEAPAEEATAEATATPLPPTLGVVTIGVNPAFEPFVFMDSESGQLVGFDIDLVNALSAAGNFEVGFVDTTFGGLFKGINAGAFDAAVGAITVTEDRKRTVDFTEPYYRSGQSPLSYYDAGQGIAVQTDNTTIIGPADLTEDMKIGVKANTTGERYVVDETPAQFVRYQEAPDALAALAAGEVDAVVVDIPVITDFVRKNPEVGVKLTGGPVTVEEYAIIVSKDKPGVLDGLNAALVQIHEDGTYDAIFQKWFGAP